MLRALTKKFPRSKDFTWRNVTLPMAKHAKDLVRAELAQEGITVDDSKIVERLKKVLVGLQRSKLKYPFNLCIRTTNHVQLAIRPLWTQQCLQLRQVALRTNRMTRSETSDE